MQKAQQRVATTLTDSRVYIGNHADVLGVVLDAPATRQLDAALVAVSAHVLAQGTAVRWSAALSERRAQLTAELKGGFLKPITQFARTRVRRDPEFARLTRSSHRKQGPALVLAAQTTAEVAKPLADALTEARFPPDFLDQLRALTDELEATLDAQVATKSARVVATSGIASALSSGREAISLLDPVVSRLLRSSELVAGWQMVKRVPRSTRATSG